VTTCETCYGTGLENPLLSARDPANGPCEVCDGAGTKPPVMTDQPLAAKGLTSYRYGGNYGWIMIGAHDDEAALREAARSTDMAISIDNLQRWNGVEYVPC
jgi:hypothetical protein